MKRALLVLFVCVLVLPRSGVAQEVADQAHASWGAMTGGVGVTGTFRGFLEEGVTGGALALVPLPSRHLSLRADLLYNWIGTGRGDMVDVVTPGGRANNGRCDVGITCLIESGWSRIVSASVSVVARVNGPSTRWSPYAFGGVAGYLTGNSDEPLAQIRANHLGFQGGVGFEVRPMINTYFVEMRYLGIPPGGVLPITIGMRF